MAGEGVTSVTTILQKLACHMITIRSCMSRMLRNSICSHHDVLNVLLRILCICSTLHGIAQIMIK